MKDDMKNGKTIGISTIFGQENLKVVCVERKYKVSNSKVGFFVTAKKVLDENTTQELLHEDMELKTFLANYEITDVMPVPVSQESVDSTEKGGIVGDSGRLRNADIGSARKSSMVNIMTNKSRVKTKNDDKFAGKDGVLDKKTEAMKRVDLFDSLNLPDSFLIKDYKKALEEIGISITNTAMPYDDLERLEKQGKITRIGKGEHGAVSFLKKKKEGAIAV